MIDKLLSRFGLVRWKFIHEQLDYARKAAEAAGVNIKNAPFLLDLREENGDIIDTIGISAEMYTRITGEPVLSAEEYREIDTKWWQAAKGLSENIEKFSEA